MRFGFECFAVTSSILNYPPKCKLHRFVPKNFGIEEPPGSKERPKPAAKRTQVLQRARQCLLRPCKAHTRRAGVGKLLGKCHKYLPIFPEIAEPEQALPAAITARVRNCLSWSLYR